MGSFHWVSSSSMTGLHTKRGNWNADTHRGERRQRDTGRRWPSLRREGRPEPAFPQGTTCRHLDLGLPASRPETIHFCCLSSSPRPPPPIPSRCVWCFVIAAFPRLSNQFHHVSPKYLFLQVPGLSLPWVNTHPLHEAAALLSSLVVWGEWKVGLGLRVSEGEEPGGAESPLPFLPGPGRVGNHGKWTLLWAWRLPNVTCSPAPWLPCQRELGG